jgi:hypothetical protein
VTLYPGQYFDRYNLTLSSNLIEAEYNNKPIVANTSYLTQTKEGELYTYTSDISDADTSDTLTVTASNLPAWLTLAPEANNFTLSGTPTSDDIGNYDINITVTDGKVPVHINYTLTVQAKDVASVNNGYTHRISHNSILTTLSPLVRSRWDKTNQRVFFRKGNSCTGTQAAYIALHYQGALFTAFETCNDHSFKETLNNTYPKGSKATLVSEPNTNKAMIMVEIPLGTGSITIGE